MRRRRQPPPEEPISEGFVTRNLESDDIPSDGGRFTVYLNQDGSVDWDKTKSDVGDLVVDTITKDADLLEKVAAHPGFADGTPANDPTKWQPDEAGFALDLLDKVEGLIVSRLSKQLLGQEITMRTATRAFNTTEEEHKLQDPRAAQALNDFLTVDDPKWRNLSLLCAAHGAAFTRKFREAIKMQAKEPQTVEGTFVNKANGHAPETPPPPSVPVVPAPIEDTGWAASE